MLTEPGEQERVNFIVFPPRVYPGGLYQGPIGCPHDVRKHEAPHGAGLRDVDNI